MIGTLLVALSACGNFNPDNQQKCNTRQQHSTPNDVQQKTIAPLIDQYSEAR